MFWDCIILYIIVYLIEVLDNSFFREGVFYYGFTVIPMFVQW
jgi:hypothetical protein